MYILKEIHQRSEIHPKQIYGAAILITSQLTLPVCSSRFCLNTTYYLKKGESRWTGYYCYSKFTNKPFQRLEGKNTISIKNEFLLAGRSQPSQLEKCYLFENHHYSNYKEVRSGTFPSNTSNESQRVYALSRYYGSKNLTLWGVN